MGCRLRYFEKSGGFRGLRTLASRVPESKPQPRTTLRSAISQLMAPSPARFLIDECVLSWEFKYLSVLMAYGDEEMRLLPYIYIQKR